MSGGRPAHAGQTVSCSWLCGLTTDVAYPQHQHADLRLVVVYGGEDLAPHGWQGSLRTTSRTPQ